MEVGGGCILRRRSYSASSPEGSGHTGACFCICMPPAFSCRQVIPHVPVCVLSRLSRIWLCNPVDRSQPSSSVHGILQARIQDWVAMLSSRGFSRPRGVYFIHIHKRKCYLKKREREREVYIPQAWWPLPPTGAFEKCRCPWGVFGGWKEGRVHHEKHQAGWSTSWNQDCWEKYQ